MRPAALALLLPASWSEVENPDGPRELHAGEAGSRGILQVSRFDAAAEGFVVAQRDLAALAAQMGKVLDQKSGGWGTALRTAEAPCALENGRGRFGMAVFAEGSFPAMALFVTTADALGAAWMWTYLGPDLKAVELEEAVKIATGATLAE